jgi:hypothetical protein
LVGNVLAGIFLLAVVGGVGYGGYRFVRWVADYDSGKVASATGASAPGPGVAPQSPTPAPSQTPATDGPKQGAKKKRASEIRNRIADARKQYPLPGD